MTATPDGWLNYDDFAAGIATNRLPGSDAPAGRAWAVTLDNGRRFRLVFQDAATVSVEGGEATQEACDVVNVAPDAWFIDLTFAA